jgi:hypothetical protein
MTDEIRFEIKEKHKTWYRMKASNKSKIRLENSERCRYLKQKIREAVFKFESNLVQKAEKDPKLVYAYVRSKQNVKEQIRAVLSINNELVTDK